MRGLFTGLATLDVIQLVDAVPAADEKILASDVSIAAGGPALNAAVAFAHRHQVGSAAVQRDDQATLVHRRSGDAIGTMIAADLETYGVESVCAPAIAQSTVASILVTASSGERAVISAGDRTAGAIPTRFTSVPVNVADYDVVLADGYEPDISLSLLKQAREAGILTVFDGGSVKPHTELFLPWIDCALVSANFAPQRDDELFAYLASFGVRCGAVTAGENALRWFFDRKRGEIAPPKVPTRDTLGAGDFFHGGFAKSIAGRELSIDSFIQALHDGSEIAALSVQSFGTRMWLEG